MQSNLEQELKEYVLGQTPTTLSLSTKEEHRLAAESMARQARHSVHIFTYNLDPYIYDQLPFIEALKNLAIGRQSAKILILLQDNNQVQREGHRLIELARQLPSRFEVRRPPHDYLKHPENFLLVDNVGYIKRELYTRYEGTASFHAPLDGKHMAEFFNNIWLHSEPDSTLRRLSL